ncbi:hypothetical protein D3C87_1793920 [compost metagenome]
METPPARVPSGIFGNAPYFASSCDQSTRSFSVSELSGASSCAKAALAISASAMAAMADFRCLFMVSSQVWLLE